MRQIVDAPGLEIVDTNHVGTLGDQPVAEV
jgi:hypothetical protein